MKVGNKVRVIKEFEAGIFAFEIGDILTVGNYIHKVAVYFKAQGVTDLIRFSYERMNEFVEIIEDKDPLHRLNSLIRDYCLKREFDKRYPHNDWFTVQIICKSKDYRGLMVIPEVKDSFFEKKIFEATTTKDMFDKAIKFYKELNGTDTKSNHNLKVLQEKSK